MDVEGDSRELFQHTIKGFPSCDWGKPRKPQTVGSTARYILSSRSKI